MCSIALCRNELLSYIDSHVFLPLCSRAEFQIAESVAVFTLTSVTFTVKVPLRGTYISVVRTEYSTNVAAPFLLKYMSSTTNYNQAPTIRPHTHVENHFFCPTAAAPPAYPALLAYHFPVSFLVTYKNAFLPSLPPPTYSYILLCPLHLHLLPHSVRKSFPSAPPGSISYLFCTYHGPRTPTTTLLALRGGGVV